MRGLGILGTFPDRKREKGEGKGREIKETQVIFNCIYSLKASHVNNKILKTIYRQGA